MKSNRRKFIQNLSAGAAGLTLKTGNPKGVGIPEWTKYTTANGETMILDDKCEMKNDPDREARKSLTMK